MTKPTPSVASETQTQGVCGAAPLRGTTVHIITFGCQMNKYDSAMIAGLLADKGAAATEVPAQANLILINTCSVRAHAEERVYNNLYLLRERKRREPGFMLGVIGCMAQKESEKIAKRCPWVDLVAGTHMLDELARLIERIRDGAPTPLLAVAQKPTVDFGETVARRDHRFSAFLAVSRGCNKHCAYCVVPYTRGREISRPIADVAAEAQRLVDDGVLEITLLGQTIDTYGRDLRDGTSLPKLLHALHPIAGLQRIRFVTSHPRECRPELFAAMSDLRDKVMPFMHMPPQSGSDRILRAMKRGYTRQRYVDVAAAARAACPEVEFCGDWIVGFPGETEEDFAQSLSLLEEVGFQHSFVFKYSPREGTPAERLPDDVPTEVKEERHARLAAAQERVSLAKNHARIGVIEEVLAEGPSKSNPERLTGRTRSFRLLHFPGDASLAGRVVPVRVTAATALSLQGELGGD
jgi:tRNA-2-methylthio-N6-dimethylallyladenosine synthase